MPRPTIRPLSGGLLAWGCQWASDIGVLHHSSCISTFNCGIYAEDIAELKMCSHHQGAHKPQPSWGTHAMMGQPVQLNAIICRHLASNCSDSEITMSEMPEYIVIAASFTAKKAWNSSNAPYYTRFSL